MSKGYYIIAYLYPEVKEYITLQEQMKGSFLSGKKPLPKEQQLQYQSILFG